MAFEAYIDGGMVEVDNVQAEIVAKGLKPNSFVTDIRLTVNAPDDLDDYSRLIKSVRRGIDQEETIIANLYTLQMESGHSQFIYDGLNAFHLRVKGIGSWSITWRLTATVKDGDGRVYTLAEISFERHRWYKKVPFPSEKNAMLTEEFNQAVVA